MRSGCSITTTWPGFSGTGATGHLITPRLTLHATGFYFLQTTIALLFYGLRAAFAREDDLDVGDDVVQAPLVGAEN